MDTKVKMRTVVRRHFTKCANSLENLLKAEKFIKYEAEASRKIVHEAYSKLTTLDEEIQELILADSTWEEKDLEKELDEKTKYETRWAILDTQFYSLTASSPPSEKRNFKLPTLELKKFDGKIKNWLGFWGSFQKIDSDKNMVETDKLQYLSQSMEANTDVKLFIDSFPITNNSYTLCIQDLKARYAREDLLIQVYVRELLALILDKESNKELSTLYDQLNGQLRSLEILGVTKDKFSAFLLPMVESALPPETLRAWERARPEISDDMLNSLLTFLKKEIESDQRISMANSTFTSEPLKSHEATAACFAVNIKEKRENRRENKCVWCDKTGHSNVECYKLGKLSIEERQEHLKKKRACVLCLKVGHHAKICKAYIKCYVCGQRHSPVLCPGTCQPETKPVTKHEKKDSEPALQNLSNSEKKMMGTTTFLQTVAVEVTCNGKKEKVRALFDSGSQRSYIKEEVATKLGIPDAGEEELSHSLFGGVTVSYKQYKTYNFIIESLDSNFKLEMSALGQSCICKHVPKVDNSKMARLLNNYNIRLTEIETTEIGLLIGADYLGLLLTNTFVQLENGLTAVKTNLGWTIQGKMTTANTNVVLSLFCAQNINNYWDLELLGIKDPTQVQSKQQREEEVIANFEENIHVNEQGRYEVCLPWKAGHDDLLSNQELSIRRLESTTKKLFTCGKFHDYNKILGEWEQTGIIEEVPETEKDIDGTHYLPHRAVTKEASLTTKLRPVYDASAKDKKGKSLNSCLDKGINFLDKIPKLLMGFRKGCIGVTADIAKAFLQISVTPQDRDCLRFVWWKDDSCKEIKVYRHCRVVFGLTASPFLLSATISHHLNQVTDCRNTADILAKSFYVDNLVTSLDSTEQTLQFMQEAKNIMHEGKFHLRQWVTSPLKVNESNNNVISVLGLQWDTVSDELYCNLNAFPSYKDIEKITKRNILSLAQKIFDPIGFTCPVSLIPKLILQKLWNQKTTWDEEITGDMLSQFKMWYVNIEFLKECKLPRRVSAERLQDCITSLHMFCDASKDAYAACVFLRTVNKGNVTVRLLSAKSRVSPPEKATIPRLELLAALIGSRLLVDVRKNLEVNCDEFCWCDSGVALCWIRRELPWNTYVGNRVKEIRQNTNVNNWHHIPGTENWADLASRGCDARQLLEVRWWEGPPWLLQQPELWPRSALVVDEKVANLEMKKKALCNTNTCIDKGMVESLSYYFHKYTKIVRMTAWMLRFIFNAGHRKGKKSGELTYDECVEAENKIIFIIQTESKEYIEKQCGKSTQVYYDTDKLLKVKTRLLLTDLPECTKSPVVVPAKNVIIRRMVEQRHVQLLHAGTNTMITDLRKRFWIIGIRLLVKSVINKCTVCKRHTSQPSRAPTAPLPVERVQLTAPFEITGVDLAGPLYLRDGEKCWVVLYTCAVYRAVHLELTKSLSTEAFLQTFRRFIARRGRATTMISDHGTNFTGTKHLLQNVDWDEVQRQSTIQRIRWKLNAPAAAWWGGFYERLIGLMKNLLRRVLGKNSVSYEEMQTLLCDCETVMNDRPLTYVEDDSASALEPLSPSSFLQTLCSSDTTDLDQIDTTSLNKRLKYLQKLREDFRQRFRNEYLTTLIQRQKDKWGNLKVGDIVLIEGEDKRIKWPLGLVVETFTGKDGIYRVAKVKTSAGYKTRPVQRLYRLEISSSEVEGQHSEGNGSIPTGKKFHSISNSPEAIKTNSSIDKVIETPMTDIMTEKVTRTGRVIKIPSKYNI